MKTHTVAEIQALLPFLTGEERDELERLIAADARATVWRPLPGPQTLAFESKARVVGYGGSAGGGKSDLVCGRALTRQKRVLIVRREKAQTLGIVQRLTEIIGSTDGYSQQQSKWEVETGTKPLLEFGGLDNPGDEKRWQGRPHDFIAVDEATECRESQVRFLLGWLRSNDPRVEVKVLMTFNPPTTVEGRWVLKFFAPWLDPQHPNPAKPGELRWFTTVNGVDEEVSDTRKFYIDGEGVKQYVIPPSMPPERIIEPVSRTFVPARVTDNPHYMATGYIQQLQSLPEPLRSQMLYGDFRAGVQDDAFQMIPTAWVEAAQARWTQPAKKPEMLTMGIDVARGGKDNTVVATRHEGNWYDKLTLHPGSDTPNGHVTAGYVVMAQRDSATMAIDVIGVGASPYDILNETQQIIGVNVAEGATARDKTGRLQFANLKTQLWWQMREELDPDANTGIALPPDEKLKAELCAPKWKMVGGKVGMSTQDEIVSVLGRSADRATAVVLARIEHPKRRSGANKQRHEYDPLALVDKGGSQDGVVSTYGDYDPMVGWR